MANKSRSIELMKENWRDEIIAAETYRELAKRDRSQRRCELFLKMAEIEDKHAQMWQKKLSESGVVCDPAEVAATVTRQKTLIRTFGVDATIRRIERVERNAAAGYTRQFEELGDEESLNILRQVIPDEEEHAEQLNQMANSSGKGPRTALESLLTRETWHKGGTGSWIGDAIYGVNDGLGAVFGIVSAVAGATGATSETVIIAGLAGTVGSAFSMGSSGYLAAKSEREVHEAEIERERLEIESDPQHEREELELMYQIKGFTEDEAKALVDKIVETPGQLLETMISEELGLSEERLPNPWISGFVGFSSTAIGAFLPVIPFFYASGLTAIIYSLIISIIAHFIVGALKTFVTGRSWVTQGLEMTFVGMLGGLLAYGFGLLLGAHESL